MYKFEVEFTMINNEKVTRKFVGKDAKYKTILDAIEKSLKQDNIIQVENNEYISTDKIIKFRIIEINE